MLCERSIHQNRYVYDKRKSRENVGPLWKEMAELLTGGIEKAEVLDDILPQSSLTSAPATPLKTQQAKAWTRRMKNFRL